MPTINLNSLKESAAQSIPRKSHREIKEGFRVRVCLQHFFLDERSRAYVYVVQHRPVRWLHQHLKTLFGLKRLFCLCSNGYFLPPEEPLSILQPNDPVEVIPLSDNFLNSTNEKSSKINLQSIEWANFHNLTKNIETSHHSAEEAAGEGPRLEVERDKQLICMKQQALALLEARCEDATGADLELGCVVFSTGDSDKPRRSRRRVRRRKRLFSGGDTNGITRERETNEDKNKNVQSAFKNNVTLTDNKDIAEGLVNIVEDAETTRDARDDSMDTRKARLVRSISPPQTYINE